MKVALAVPTLNAAAYLDRFLAGVDAQTLDVSRFVVFDSSSTDGTAERLRAHGADVTVIRRDEFDHGGTRQSMVEYCGDVDVIIFMTQDAVCADRESFTRLLARFDDREVGAVCGRQLAREGASAVERHARLFNYPPVSSAHSRQDVARLGIRAAFLSNSFAAYRASALRAVGGFPTGNIMNEDMYVAARLLMADYLVAYAADAQVYHSHPYGIGEEFRRYFDIGVFFARNSWLFETFGTPSGEGRRFVAAELRWLARVRPTAIPAATLRNAAKLIGVNLGRRERLLPLPLKRRLSAQPEYWRSSGVLSALT